MTPRSQNYSRIQVQTIAYNSHYGITYQYLRFGMMDILRHTEANHRYIMLYMYTMILITLESALKQVQIYEDWPHHLLLKTCYRTSANLSDGSVCSQPAYRFMFIHGCMYPRKFHIDRISVQKYLPYRFQGHFQHAVIKI
ncbi:hypothetical protein NQ317_008316 [Molorchus minor]|uniref:Uncharacterized protein n=1 Tax=Molorchus minor TaxID=1323400 RepID=A0ABQ9J0J2_9CUCU|nr:hypothetical protein NQ317_008316 [Molorchus minor]